MLLISARGRQRQADVCGRTAAIGTLNCSPSELLYYGQIPGPFTHPRPRQLHSTVLTSPVIQSLIKIRRHLSYTQRKWGISYCPSFLIHQVSPRKVACSFKVYCVPQQKQQKGVLPKVNPPKVLEETIVQVST